MISFVLVRGLTERAVGRAMAVRGALSWVCVLALCTLAHHAVLAAYASPVLEHTTASREVLEGNVTSQCELCLPGHYTNTSTNCGVNATSGAENVCPPGSCNHTEACAVCPAGFFQHEQGGVNCTMCKTGFVAVAGSSKCTPCPTGATNNANHSECNKCPPGYMNPNAGSVCTMCVIGTYQPSSGGIYCFECPYGTYGDTPALPFCTPCGKGKYNNVLGATSRSECLTCPSGSYCPDDNTYQPLQCPKNNYCGTGVSKPSECAFLQVADPGSSSCARSTSFWIFMTAGTILLIAVITGVILSAFFYLQRKSAEQEKPKKERLIPEPLSGPVYGGY